jgi:hypothetical protein
MIDITDRTPDHMSAIEVAAALDISTAELGLRRKLHMLPEPVGVLRRKHSGRPRFLWNRATIEAYAASGAGLRAAKADAGEAV